MRTSSRQEQPSAKPKDTTSRLGRAGLRLDYPAWKLALFVRYNVGSGSWRIRDVCLGTTAAIGALAWRGVRALSANDPPCLASGLDALVSTRTTGSVDQIARVEHALLLHYTQAHTLSPVSLVGGERRDQVVCHRTRAAPVDKRKADAKATWPWAGP